MQTPASASVVVPARPRAGQLLGAGALTAVAASLVMWWIDASFYRRFQVMPGELPGWSPWSALQLSNQFLGWVAAAALWAAWPRRHLAAIAALVLLGLAGLVAHTWVQHEARRAWAGTPVWPKHFLPFDFSARAATMIPVGSATLPHGVPSRVLLLRSDPYSALVYDPATHETSWIGNEIATWSIRDGGKAWPR